MSVTERIHTFGEGGSLTGVVTLPPGDLGAAASPEAARPFVVILNAGLVHRIGPFRMGVDLARRLAAGGSRVLRFDQSGIGDSPSRGSAGTVEERAESDGRQAMSFLADRYGARAFAVGGLCTGAMNAHRLGVVDERVTALWLLDGYAYPTWPGLGRRIAGALRRPRSWPSVGRRLAAEAKEYVLSRLGSTGHLAPVTPPADARTALFFQDWPPLASVRRDLERMLLRGSHMLFVYSGGWSGYEHAGQFDEMFPRLPCRERVTVDFQPGADHTFFALADREAMFRSVERLLARVRPQ